MTNVKQEKTGYRDLALSQRHRTWGFDCPAVDIDFLLIEYDKGEPIAIIEYKHGNATAQYSSHPTYKALMNLGTRAGVPVFCVRYEDSFCAWKVVPLNKIAFAFLSQKTQMNEREYVSFLYRMRGKELPESLLIDIK